MLQSWTISDIKVCPTNPIRSPSNTRVMYRHSLATSTYLQNHIYCFDHTSRKKYPVTNRTNVNELISNKEKIWLYTCGTVWQQFIEIHIALSVARKKYTS